MVGGQGPLANLYLATSFLKWLPSSLADSECRFCGDLCHASDLQKLFELKYLLPVARGATVG